MFYLFFYLFFFRAPDNVCKLVRKLQANVCSPVETRGLGIKDVDRLALQIGEI